MVGKHRTYLAAAVALALVLPPSLVPADEPAGRPPTAPPVPQEGRMVDLRVLGVNDLHGNLEPLRDENGRVVGGVAYLDASRPEGQRVTAILPKTGRPIDPRGSYTVTVDAFLAAGQDGFDSFRDGTDRRVVGTDIDALTSDTCRSPSPPPTLGRRGGYPSPAGDLAPCLRPREV